MSFRQLLFPLKGLLIVYLCASACTKAGGKKNDIAFSQAASDTAAIARYIKKANGFVQTNFDSMYYYMELAKNKSVALNYKAGEASARAVESNYLRRKGEYAAAIDLGLQVVNMYDSLGMWKEAVRLKNLLADMYKEMGGQKGTVDYLLKGIELSKQGQAMAAGKNYTAGIVSSLNQQAITWRDMSKQTGRKDLMDTAFHLYEQGIRLINETGEGKEDLGKFYNNISQVYNEHYKNYPVALDYLNKAVAFNSSRNNQNSLTHNYNTMSEVYLNMGDLERAKAYAQKMLAICVELKSPARMVNAYSLLTKLNKQLGRYDSALHYRDLGVAMADSMDNVKKAQLIAESQTKYETGKKEERISELGKMNEMKNQRLWLAFGLVALFAVLIAVSMLQNRRLQKQKAQITEQSNRLQWMMKELHHRVKNNLQIVSSLLSLQSYRLKDEESVSAIKESQLRVQAMSLIHQRLYQVEDVSMVNFKLYLDDLVETLMRSYGYGADDFDLQVNVEKELLDVDTVMPMGLLVNEIITNSFKYAYKEVKRPLLHISLSSGNEQLELAIKDNGPGLHTATAAQNKQGFGKKLIDALSKQLKASWSVDSSAGTVYHFTIPDNKKDKAA